MFGTGLSLDNYSEIIPHNFVLELFVSTGLIVGGIVMYMIISLLRYINAYEYKYIIWGVFLGSMFITNFQGNGFAIVFIIIAIVSVEMMRKEKSGPVILRNRYLRRVPSLATMLKVKCSKAYTRWLRRIKQNIGIQN
jgi:hypothetical protein